MRLDQSKERLGVDQGRELTGQYVRTHRRHSGTNKRQEQKRTQQRTKRQSERDTNRNHLDIHTDALDAPAHTHISNTQTHPQRARAKGRREPMNE
mmetsp:Transcript_2282/g.4812  ORF Transcript_2282/g.4812 Transcript_2282/m.4812 type:complete len:95 (-) Transcript_2282:27-311(-)